MHTKRKMNENLIKRAFQLGYLRGIRSFVKSADDVDVLNEVARLQMEAEARKKKRRRLARTIALSVGIGVPALGAAGYLGYRMYKNRGNSSSPKQPTWDNHEKTAPGEHLVNAQKEQNLPLIVRTYRALVNGPGDIKKEEADRRARDYQHVQEIVQRNQAWRDAGASGQ